MEYVILSSAIAAVIAAIVMIVDSITSTNFETISNNLQTALFRSSPDSAAHSVGSQIRGYIS